MTEPQATWLLLTLAAYLALGVVFAVPFLWRGAAAIDDDAAEGSLGFKLLVLPGTVALWPVLLRLWLTRGRTSS